MDFVWTDGTSPHVTALEVGLLLQRCGLSGDVYENVCAMVFPGFLLRRKDVSRLKRSCSH